jgi:hypothetical protein
MHIEKALDQTYPVHPPEERRGKSRLQEDATIKVRNCAKKRNGFTTVPLIESTRHGARLVMTGSAKCDDGIEFIVRMGRNTFQGQARVAWTQPLSNERSVVGLEFLTFRLA